MKRKALALLVAAAMVLGTAAPSFAASETRNISASYSGIKLCIDLKPVVLADANGDITEPFIADGSTYLPVRAVSEALGLTVVWDGETKSVRISESAEAAAEPDEAPAAAEEDKDAGKVLTAVEDKDKDPAAAEKVWRWTDTTDWDFAAEESDAAKTEETTVSEEADKEADDDAKTEEADAAKTEEADAAEAPETPAAPPETYEPFIGTKTLSAVYDNIAIYVNDKQISPKDAAGNAAEPFISNGTTYLPVRAIAESLGLTVSWDGAAKTVYVGEQPEKTAAADVYAKYAAAAEALEAAGASCVADISGDLAVTIGDEAMDAKMSGSVKQINHSATDIELSADMTVSVAGQDLATKIYYKDGFLYTEAAGEKIKVELPIDQALKQAGTGNFDLEEDAIKEASAEGNTLKFTMDGNKLKSLADTALAGLGSLASSVGEYEIGDIAFTAVLDDKGALKTVNMVYSMSVTAEDATTSIDYDLTMTYTQIGDVSITAPADLDAYKELDLNAEAK